MKKREKGGFALGELAKAKETIHVQAYQLTYKPIEANEGDVVKNLHFRAKL